MLSDNGLGEVSFDIWHMNEESEGKLRCRYKLGMFKVL